MNEAWRTDGGSACARPRNEVVLGPSAERASRWLTKGELDDFLVRYDLSTDTIPDNKGGVVLWSDGNEVYVDTSMGHTMIVAMTDSGKTRTLIMPTVDVLSRARESMVIHDPKGEISQMFYWKLVDLGYDVRVLNLRDPEKGDCWNLLSVPYRLWKSGDQDAARAMLMDITIHLSPATKSNDPFWEKACQQFLYGMICTLIDRADDESEANFWSLANAIGIACEDEFSMERFANTFPKNSIELSQMSVLLNNSENTRRCILGMVHDALSIMISKGDLNRMMARNEFDMDSIGLRPTAVLIITPDEKATYNALVGRFVTQLNDRLIHKAQEFPEKRLPVRVNLILDEMASLSRIENLHSMLSAGRSRNVRYIMALQSVKQLNIYGKEAESIMDNCANWVYLNGRDTDFIDVLCKLAGRDKDGSPLITPAQLLRLKKGKEAFVISGREFPFITRIADISLYDLGKRRDYIPQTRTDISQPAVIGERIFLQSKPKAQEPVRKRRGLFD